MPGARIISEFSAFKLSKIGDKLIIQNRQGKVKTLITHFPPELIFRQRNPVDITIQELPPKR